MVTTTKIITTGLTRQERVAVATMLSDIGRAMRLRRYREEQVAELATKTGLDAATVAEIIREAVG